VDPVPDPLLFFSPFLEAPPKLQLTLSAQTEVFLSLAFTLLRQFVKHSRTLSAPPVPVPVPEPL
jgi:hypothetical protein